jgi:hypothetical protein
LLCFHSDSIGEGARHSKRFSSDLGFARFQASWSSN